MDLDLLAEIPDQVRRVPQRKYESHFELTYQQPANCPVCAKRPCLGYLRVFDSTCDDWPGRHGGYGKNALDSYGGTGAIYVWWKEQGCPAIIACGACIKKLHFSGS
jgi:hypothetical protein